MAMALGNYTFDKNPSEMTVVKNDRIVSFVRTYESVAVFSWGTTIAGKQLYLKWGGMTTAQFNELQTLLEADAQVEFFPDIDSGTSYIVEIIDLDGHYHISQSDAAEYRTDVSLQLLVIS